MATTTGVRLTKAGEALLAKLHTGIVSKLELTNFVIGDAVWTEEEADDATYTTLKNERVRAPIIEIIAGSENNTGRILCTGVVNNVGITETFYVREIGIMAIDPDLGEILYLVDTIAECAPTTVIEENAVRQDVPIRMELIALSRGQVELTLSESVAYVTPDQLETSSDGIYSYIGDKLKDFDADTVDGKHASDFAIWDHTHTEMVASSRLPIATQAEVTAGDINNKIITPSGLASGFNIRRHITDANNRVELNQSILGRLKNGSLDKHERFTFHCTHPEAPKEYQDKDFWWFCISRTFHSNGWWELFCICPSLHATAICGVDQRVSSVIAPNLWAVNTPNIDIRKYITDIPHPFNKVELNQSILGSLKDGSLDKHERFIFHCTHPEAPKEYQDKDFWWFVVSRTFHSGEYWEVVATNAERGYIATIEGQTTNSKLDSSAWAVITPELNVRKSLVDMPHPLNSIELNQSILGRLKDGSLDKHERFFFNSEHPEAPDTLRGANKWWFCISRTFHSGGCWELFCISPGLQGVATCGVDQRVRAVIDPKMWVEFYGTKSPNNFATDQQRGIVRYATPQEIENRANNVVVSPVQLRNHVDFKILYPEPRKISANQRRIVTNPFGTSPCLVEAQIYSDGTGVWHNTGHVGWWEWEGNENPYARFCAASTYAGNIVIQTGFDGVQDAHACLSGAPHSNGIKIQEAFYRVLVWKIGSGTTLLQQ